MKRQESHLRNQERIPELLMKRRKEIIIGFRKRTKRINI